MSRFRYKPARNNRRLVRLLVMLLFVSFFGTVGYTAIHASFGAPLDEAATEPIVVQYKSNANDTGITATYRQHRAVQSRQIPQLRSTVVKVPKSQRDQTIKDLLSDPQVLTAEPDYTAHAEATTPNDEFYARQTEWVQTHVNEAWDTTKGNALVIAVLDTGANLVHPDLVGKTVAGYDYINNDTDPTDDEGHGTAVSGTLAANTNNRTGTAGGCWNCKIMPIKVLDASASGAASGIAQGIQFAIDHGANIINLSLSMDSDSSVVKTAIDNAASKNILVVAAAGNQGASAPRWPAAYPSVVSVAGVNTDDTLNVGSNSGTTIDIAAPWQVFSTSYPGEVWGGWLGTSFASPIVASVGALLMSAYPNATLANIKTAMTSTADPCCGGSIPGGRVNAAKALAYLATLYPPTDTTKPTVSITAPLANATVSGTTAITASAADNTAVTKVTFQIDSGTATSVTTTPYSYTWNTAQVSDGVHSVTVTAYDAANNNATATVSITVKNNTTTPPPPPPSTTPILGDLNADNKVNITDLSILLSSWNKANTTADINKSGKVDITDLSILLSHWTG